MNIIWWIASGVAWLFLGWLGGVILKKSDTHPEAASPTDELFLRIVILLGPITCVAGVLLWKVGPWLSRIKPKTTWFGGPKP